MYLLPDQNSSGFDLDATETKKKKKKKTHQETEKESDVFGVEMRNSNDNEIHNKVYNILAGLL